MNEENCTQFPDIGGKYNWKNQEERLQYMGHNWSGNGFWHQFSLVSNPDVVWCEVQTNELNLLEKS